MRETSHLTRFSTQADFKFAVLMMNPPQTKAGHGVPQGNILGCLIKESFTWADRQANNSFQLCIYVRIKAIAVKNFTSCSCNLEDSYLSSQAERAQFHPWGMWDGSLEGVEQSSSLFQTLLFKWTFTCWLLQIYNLLKHFQLLCALMCPEGEWLHLTAPGVEV